jgi:hypothetical protein
VANFVRRLNNGTNGRYKGKLPLICFNCDGIVHFANKCPHCKKNKKIRGMMKITQITNKHIKAKGQKINLSRKSYAPKKTSPH